MSNLEREIVLRAPGGLYRCGTPQFGALIGDRAQTRNNISLGPGLAVGHDCRIASGVTLAGRTIPAHSAITAPHTAETHVRQRPAQRNPPAPEPARGDFKQVSAGAVTEQGR